MRRAYVRRKKRYSPVDIILSAILILCGLICLGPILNTVAISFSDKTSAAMGKVGLIPIGFNWVGYKAILEEGQFFRSFMVSVERVILGTALNMVLTIWLIHCLRM